MSGAEGHGDHWSCLGEDINGLVARSLELVTTNPTVIELDRRSTPEGEQILIAEGVKGDGLGVLALCEAKQVEKVLDIRSAFPMAFAGAETTLVADNVRQWINGFEAVIDAHFEPDGASVSFFDCGYFKTRPYRIGEPLHVNLAILAYSLGPAQIQSWETTDQEQLRRLWEISADDSLAPNEDGVFEPITHTSEGMSSLLPSDGDFPEDASFSGVIQEISEISLFGIRVIKAVVNVINSDAPVMMPIYVSRAKLLEGYEPRLGDWVWGTGWVHGYPVGMFVEQAYSDA